MFWHCFSCRFSRRHHARCILRWRLVSSSWIPSLEWLSGMVFNKVYFIGIALACQKMGPTKHLFAKFMSIAIVSPCPMICPIQTSCSFTDFFTVFLTHKLSIKVCYIAIACLHEKLDHFENCSENVVFAFSFSLCSQPPLWMIQMHRSLKTTWRVKVQ